MLNEVKLKQENQVEKYRSYRIGELPDIQIRYSDIIIPLQALAQYDNHTARLLYASLFTSILNALEDKLSADEYSELILTIQHRFDVMLSQSEIFYPSFVAAILDIVLSKPEQMQNLCTIYQCIDCCKSFRICRNFNYRMFYTA